jgi:serine/threonine protein kinase
MKSMFGGTPLFMAPELHDEQPYKESTDLFAFGVTAYRIYFGKLPFTSVVKLLKGDLVIPANTFPRWVTQYISRLMSANPKNRPTCMEILKLPELAPIVDEFQKTYLKAFSNVKAQIDAKHNALIKGEEETKGPTKADMNAQKHEQKVA